MYRLHLILFAVVFISTGCSTKKKEKNNHPFTQIEENVELKKSEETPVEPTLEDSIIQIREWFKINNRNSNAGNYTQKHFKVEADTLKIEIIEFSNSLNKARQKVIYKSNRDKYDLPITDTIGNIKNLTREYYYRENRLFFIYDVLEVEEDSTTKKIENRFYFGPTKMLRWIHQKSTMDRSSQKFKTIQDFFFNSKAHLIQPFNYLTQYNGAVSIVNGTRESLIEDLNEALLLKYRELDSAKIIFDAAAHGVKDDILVELFKTNESYLYLFEIQDQITKWIGKAQLIGKLTSKNPELIRTPGDLFYFLMDLERKKDTLGLRKMILSQGFEFNINGYYNEDNEQEEPTEYQENYRIAKDSVNFDNLRFRFHPYIFTYHVAIDSEFNQDGVASIGYWGGGFSEFIIVKSDSKNRFYLIRNNANSH